MSYISNKTTAPAGEYYIVFKISDQAGNEAFHTTEVAVSAFSYLLPITPFTPPTDESPPAVGEGQGEGEEQSFGNESNGNIGSETTSTNSGAEVVFATANLTAGGLTSFTSGNQNTTTPVTNNNILWGAVAAAALGATFAEWQRQKQDEERRRAEQPRGTSKGARAKYEAKMRQKRIVGESQALLDKKRKAEDEQRDRQPQSFFHIGYPHSNNNTNTMHPDLVKFDVESNGAWSDAEKAVVSESAGDVAIAYARQINQENQMLLRMGEIPNYSPISPTRAFVHIPGGPITFFRSGSITGYAGETRNRNTIVLYNVENSPNYFSQHPLVIVHEIGHAFNNATGKDSQNTVNSNLYRPITETETRNGIILDVEHGNAVDGYYGFAGGYDQWQFGNSPASENSEVFADMFIGWVYNQWEVGIDGNLTDLGNQREGFMNNEMPTLIESVEPPPDI